MEWLRSTVTLKGSAKLFNSMRCSIRKKNCLSLKILFSYRSKSRKVRHKHRSLAATKKNTFKISSKTRTLRIKRKKRSLSLWTQKTLILSPFKCEPLKMVGQVKQTMFCISVNNLDPIRTKSFMSKRLLTTTRFTQWETNNLITHYTLR
jgi:hypothetical protein